MVDAAVGRLKDGARSLLRPTDPLAPLSRRSQIFDVIMALSLGVIAISAGRGGDDQDRATQIVPNPDGPGVVIQGPPPAPFLPIDQDQAGSTALMVLAIVLPLAFRRRYPLTVLWIVLVTALTSDSDAALRLSFFACVIAAYSATVYSPYRVPALVSLPIAAFVYTQIREPAVPTVPDGAVPFLILIPIAVAADGLRRWKRRADEGRAQLSAMELEQADALRRAAAHERARIASELHDVVTHNVSVMVIQAGAARKVMDANPDQAREALLAVEAGGRAAMGELRHVMGLLTMDSAGHESATDADLTPQPGLDRLDTLVQRVRDSGTPVELTLAGVQRPLPAAVELSAYRVVQEALTNTVKHAVGASATVTVEYAVDHLRVEVTDTGGTAAGSATNGNGRGLVGLRERLAVFSGTLQAGRRPSGGYRVKALFPLEAP